MSRPRTLLSAISSEPIFMAAYELPPRATNKARTDTTFANDTITGAIIGVGSIRRLSAVRWGVAGRIVWAWILTIPAAAAIAAVVYWVTAATVAP